MSWPNDYQINLLTHTQKKITSLKAMLRLDAESAFLGAGRLQFMIMYLSNLNLRRRGPKFKKNRLLLKVGLIALQKNA